MRSLSRRVEELEKSNELREIQNVWIEDNYTLTIRFFSSDQGKWVKKKYISEPTPLKLHQDKSLVRLIMGPFGSGKSSACMAEIIFKACDMPSCWDGVRRSRWVMVRNTYGELQSTTLQTWLSWFGNLGEVKSLVKPPYLKHIFNDGKGLVELEIVFLALDRDEDIKKLKSAEYTGAYLNEASELPPSVLETMTGRVGRYPKASDVNEVPFWKGIIADTNPPDTESYLYRIFEIDKPQKHVLFKQPAGLLDSENGYITNPKAENLSHLPEDYYLNQSYGASKEFVNVFCKGQYGILSTGKPVYPEYNDDVHSQSTLTPLRELPLDLSFDFGLTPACLITQFTADGRLLVLRELVSKDMFIENFLEEMVLPTLSNFYKDFKIGTVIGDESGMAGYKAGATTCFDYLHEAGFRQAAPAKTNDLEPRLNAVKYFLNKLPGGKPAIIISRENCSVLRKGFIKGYEYSKQKIAHKDTYKEVPNKNDYSHIHDTLQYRSLEYIPHQIKAKEIDIRHYLAPIPQKSEARYGY